MIRINYCLICDHTVNSHEIAMHTEQRGVCMEEGCECLSLETPSREGLGREVERLNNLLDLKTRQYETALRKLDQLHLAGVVDTSEIVYMLENLR